MNSLSHAMRIVGLWSACASMAAALEDAPLVFENVAAMRKIGSSALPDHQVARVLGYYAANDGGGGEFYWVRAGSAPLPAANLGTVIAPITAPDSGRWIRLVNTHALNVLWFGVKPIAFDDPDIDTAASQIASANLARIHDAIESIPAIPGGASASGPAHSVRLYFPSLPYVRGGLKESWVANTQATIYFISDTLRVTKNCTISGDGMDRSHLIFAPGTAPSARREKFIVDFEKWAAAGREPSQGESFECHLQDIAIAGGTDNPGSSGVRMDGAQMSSISNVAVSDVGLRGVVASAYFIHNLSVHRVTRGPGLEVTQNESDFGFCSASHIFVGFVNVTGASKGFAAGPHMDTGEKGIGDRDYWPAVQLNRCEHFNCSDLRIERAPIALKIGHCGAVNIQHLTASPPQGKGLSAVKLQNPRDGGYIGPVHIHTLGVEGYDSAVWDHSKSASNDTPSDLKYPALSSFHRENNDLYSGRLRVQGQGAETPLQVFAHSTSKGAADWLCEMFGAPLPGGPGPALRVRNDGLIETWGGTVPVSTQPLRIVQTPLMQAKLPALDGFGSKEQIVAVSGSTLNRSAVVTAGFVRRDGANALPSGVIADASVIDSGHVAIRFTNLGKDPQPGGTDLSFRLIIHNGEEATAK